MKFSYYNHFRGNVKFGAQGDGLGVMFMAEPWRKDHGLFVNF
jgi:hypothetical protein